MHRQAHGNRPALRLWAAAALILGVVLALASAQRPARATLEDSITYTVSQSPAIGAVLQVGQVLAFSVNVTDAPNAYSGPVVFDLRKPANTTYAGFGQQSGNIITAWSWFGVNMLGVGLHSYGFMDSAFKWLMFFNASQLAIIGLGLLPLPSWKSFRSVNSTPSDPGKTTPAAA